MKTRQEALIEVTNQLSAKAMEAYSQFNEKMSQADPDYAIKWMKNLMRLIY